jgi:competence protein ComEA
MSVTPEERRALLFLVFLIVTGSAVRLVQALSPRWTPDLVPLAGAPTGTAPAQAPGRPEAGAPVAGVSDSGAATAGAPPADAGAFEPAPAWPYHAGRLDLNTATAADLATLPGIGEKLAARIIADRDARGPFGAVEDLERVPGIGPSKLARLREAVMTADPR